MENLLFSLNATMPVFIMMALGIFLKHVGVIDETFAAKMNKFVFVVPLPCLLFDQLSDVDFAAAWNTKFILFCFGATAVCIFIAFLISLLIKCKSLRGEFIQASYRSSAALLGIAFITNIYGDAGFAPLMIIGSVPLYNVMAVVILSVFRPGNQGLDRKLLKKTLIGIVTNPIIIGIAAGLIWSLLRLPMPAALASTTSMLGRMASPMGLIAMGACFDFKKAFAAKKPAITAAFLKLLGFCALFLPLAIWFGFRNQELVSLLVMLGSSSTVTCYVMARNMGHEGVLTSSTVMLTTMLCGFTLTMWLFFLRLQGMV